jgi:hypothetical protein
MRVLRQVSCGAVMLGLLQAFGALNFNQIWFQFLATLATLFATVFFGDPSALTA